LSFVQDEIHKRYKHGSALHMMCWMNFWCGLYYLPILFLFSSVGIDLAAFCLQHPEVGPAACSPGAVLAHLKSDRASRH
jgi:UDP-galactose transporter B1